jgi:hypothetical protein
MKHFDMGSLIVIAITFCLFVMALFFTGFTHALLLEAGVFLVSVKLILMAYKSSVSSAKIESELAIIKNSLNDREST